MQPLRITMPKTMREEGRRCAARRRAPFINLLAVKHFFLAFSPARRSAATAAATAAAALHRKEKRRLEFRSSKGEAVEETEEAA